MNCLRKDELYQGLFQKYTYTVTNELPVGNYAIKNDYGTFWMFTTDVYLESGNKLEYDTTQKTVAQKNGDAILNNYLEEKDARFDAVTYPSDNIIYMTTVTRGRIDSNTGEEVLDDGYTKTGFMHIYPNSTYHVDIPSNQSGNLAYALYDENRYFLRGGTVQDEGTIPTGPEAVEKEASDGTRITVNILPKYLRVSASAVDIEQCVIHMVDYNEYVVTNDECYKILTGAVGSETRKGIVNLTGMFANTADLTYEQYLAAMQAAQRAVTAYENQMKDTLGELYREGYWEDDSYVEGDE